MSRITGYGASASCDDPFNATKAVRKAVAARFDGKDEWSGFAAWVMTFVCSEAGCGASATPDLLGWGRDYDWRRVHSAASFSGGPVPALAVVAGRYLSVSGVPRCFDLVEDETVVKVPDDWVECRVYNLRMLYKAFIKHWKGDARG